jgi:hypothetical protein
VEAPSVHADTGRRARRQRLAATQAAAPHLGRRQRPLMLRAGELLPEPAPDASAAKRSTVRDSVKLGDRRRERTMAQCLRRFDSNAGRDRPHRSLPAARLPGRYRLSRRALRLRWHRALRLGWHILGREVRLAARASWFQARKIVTILTRPTPNRGCELEAVRAQGWWLGLRSRAPPCSSLRPSRTQSLC